MKKLKKKKIGREDLNKLIGWEMMIIAMMIIKILMTLKEIKQHFKRIDI